MTTDLKALADVIDRLLSGQVRLAYLFGSFASGRAGVHSDLDLAVLPFEPVSDETIWNWGQMLAVELDRDVDLINLMSCSTVLRYQVVTEGKLLFDPEGDAAGFDTETYRMYQDLQLERQDNLTAFKQRWQQDAALAGEDNE